MALKEEKYEGRALWDWPDKAVRSREVAALQAVRAELAEEIDFRVFLQYLFFTQWNALQDDANAHGVEIIGDIPIRVPARLCRCLGSAPSCSRSADYKPKRVAGVPPDYYSETGQLWGNPVYDWQIHEPARVCVVDLAHQDQHGAL